MSFATVLLDGRALRVERGCVASVCVEFGLHHAVLVAACSGTALHVRGTGLVLRGSGSGGTFFAGCSATCAELALEPDCGGGGGGGTERHALEGAARAAQQQRLQKQPRAGAFPALRAVGGTARRLLCTRGACALSVRVACFVGGSVRERMCVVRARRGCIAARRWRVDAVTANDCSRRGSSSSMRCSGDGVARTGGGIVAACSGAVGGVCGALRGASVSFSTVMRFVQRDRAAFGWGGDGVRTAVWLRAPRG